MPKMPTQYSKFSRKILFSILIGLFSFSLVGTHPANAAPAGGSLSLNGTSSYVTFGSAAGLGVTNFTLEAMIYWTGNGAATSTGAGGITAIPIISKGRAESDGSNLDMNYFLGITTAGNLAADFEDTATGLNHPVTATSAILTNTWNHVAATYNSTTGAWFLYVNGIQVGTANAGAGILPRSDSIQHAAIGTAMTSTGTAAGFFAGRIDEARIWNSDRTPAQIQAGMFTEINSGANLVARWGMTEGAGATINSSVGSFPGTLTNAPTWHSGYPLGSAIRFDGTNDYVTFGNTNALGATNFTLETWFYWTGGGVTTTTGTGGATTAIPLVTKGRGEAENSNVDMNYFLGIQNNRLAADFEEGAGQPNPALNHPIFGNTVITTNTWHHAAVTYDSASAVWILYLDGVLDATLDLGSNIAPRSDSIQHAGLGTAMTSAGTAAGFFPGIIDEARIWNVVRTPAEIQTNRYSELTSGTGLIARWGFGEGTGTAAADSVVPVQNGTLTNGPTWVPGFPFPAPVDLTPPAAPIGLTATPYSNGVLLNWTANADPDLAGYNIYRSTSPSVPLVGPINGGTLFTGTTYNDGGLINGTTYYYVVTAVDTSANQSAASNEVSATPLLSLGSAVQFNGSTQYSTFGVSNALASPTYTIETWFKRTGPGVGVTTGGGGIASAIPLITKGTSEAEAANVDINYFLGIDAGTGTLIADFEEGAGGATVSQNHPVSGTTVIANNVWYHAAATYDGTTLNLYLNGTLEGSVVVGQPSASATTSPTAFATSIRSNGTTLQGFFQGVMDEARIWNRALPLPELQSNINTQLTSGTGLIARWGMNEGSGTVISSSVGTFDGTLTNGPLWVPGAPFNLTFNAPPSAPTLVSPSDNSTDTSTSPTLSVDVSDPDGGNLTVQFYGRPVGAVAGADFSIIAIPDTQYYTSSMNGGTPAIMDTQTQWVVDNMAANNIQFVTQLGDCTEHGDQFIIEWQRADQFFQTIENPLTTGLTYGMPYGIAPGNHDQTPIGTPNGTTLYNQFFGEARFLGRDYYGGHYGTNNDNHYELFSASGMDFIVVHLAYDTSANAAVLNWADNLLQTYSTRRAIIVTHWLINGGNNATYSAQGQAIYNALKDNPNLFLMLGGHVPSPAEGQRSDTFNGNTVYSLMSDYQGRTAGGNGWLRIITISPANNNIQVKTYSPWLDQFETDADSQFTLPANLVNSFQLIGTDTVPSGGTASVTWPGLNNSTEYEWYAVVSDGSASATSSTWSFTTEAPANVAPIITGQNPLSTNEETALTIIPADLTVTDPDNIYPTGFSLTVQSGANYTVAGTTITPALDFNGTLTVPVLVNDGIADSNVFNLSVTVNPINDLPVIIGQNPLSTNEDTNLTIALADLLVSDVDNTYPTGFSLTVQSGTNYTFTGNTITPALNFNGTLTVPVIVNDGTGNSLPFNLTVTVNPVNDVPTITGQNPLSTNEDTDLTIVLANLLVTDVDNIYPTGFSLTVQSGANYSVVGATITPDAQFSGTLTVPVLVNDGTNDSNVFDLTVTVNAQNDAPTVTNPGAQTSAEGSVVSLQILAADTDIPADTLTYSATNLPQGLSINTTTGLINGTLTYHAAAGSPYNVTVTANDGTTSSSANFTWTVSQAASGLCPNDAALVGCWQMEEGSGAFVIDGTSFGNDGAITGTPTWPAGVNGLALDLSGTAQYAMVPDSNSLDIATNKITLVAWIKPEKVATQNIIKKTTGTTTANGYELSLSAAGKVFMRLNGNALYRIDSIASYPTNGNTWMHVAATYDGTNLRMYVNGVLDNTRAATLTIAPNATNLGIGAEPTFINLYQGLLDDTRVYNRDLSLAEIQALFGNTQPTTSGIAPVNVNEDAADTSIDLWTSFADAEDADSALTYTITTNSNPALFTSASIAANQNLVLDYAPNVFGTSNITIRATDTGGMFVETTFAVTVTSVNDVPTITGQNPLSTNENTALAITLANLFVTDADNTYPTGFTLTVLSGTTYTVAGNTITPSLNFNGTITVPVQVNDGTDNSNIFNLTVTVNAVNDVPVITGQSPLSTNEDTSLTIALSDLLVTDSDNPYPTGFSLTVQSGANYSVAGATITPALNFNGALIVPVRVNDGAANSNIFNLTVTVNRVNDIPSITNPGAQTNLEGATVSLPIVANDVDNASLTYSATNLPTGLAINPANGSINGAVDYTAAALSPFNVTVSVSDGVGGVASVNFTWTITDAIPPASGLVCTDLASKPATVSTGEKPQSKVWQHDGIWWAVFPTNASGASSAGTWLWRLQGTTWIEELKLSNATNTKADVKTSGDVVHILLYAGTTTQLVSAEYNGASYVTWSGRAAPSNISLANSEIATIDIDSTGRMWLATENDATGQIVAYYSDSPYSTWSAPVTIATGVNNDDIATIIAMPSNQIGILWSNQNTQRFGFRIHNDGAAPGTWAADEVPASQSAQNVGLGMADDHLHMTVASDGTIYAVVKTSYDVLGYPKIALLVRRPAGTWDNLYNIDDTGTRATLMLDEVNGYLTVLYTSAEGYNPMVYKQSTIAPIAFGNRTTLRAAAFNDASASKGKYTSELVTIFANATQVSGEICAPIPPAGADLSITKTDGTIAVRPTDNVTYTIVVSNNGPQAVTGASVQDTLPAEFSSAAWTCTGTGGGTCFTNGTGSINDLANLPVNASVTYTLNAQVSNTATNGFTNTATVSTPVGMTDPLLANNSASDTDSIIATTAACENDPTLVGCWPMEEGSGTVILDGSTYFNDGATVNGAAWVPGQSGLALDLNGTNQYVAVPDNATLDLTTQMTVALWIRPDRQATQDLVKKAINGGTNGFEVALATNQPSSPAPSKVFVRFNQQTSGDTYRVNSVTNYPFDGATWMHVAATYDGTTIKLYINGVLESSMAANVAIATNNLPLTIGAQSDNSRYYQGSMDEVRVYNRALTIDEVQTLFGNHPPVAVTDPYTTNEDTAINASIATGLLSNDTDPDLDALTAVKDSDPVNGTLMLNANGSFVYTPTANTCGNDSFTYHANDGQFNSAVTTVDLTVTCVNDVPTTSGIANATVNEDALDSTIDLWPSFADVEDADNLLTYTVTGNTNAALFTSVSVVGGQNLVLDYAPDQTGSTQITVHATDAGLPSQFIETTFTVTVNAVNDGPTTSGISNVLVDEDAADTSIDLWLSFADIDDADNTLTYTITGNTNAGLFTTATVNAGQFLVLNYAPNTSGVAQITVRATDSGSLFAETTFTVTVNPVSDPPTFTSAPILVALEDNMYTYNITTSDPDTGDTLTISAPTLPSWLTLTDNGNGTATLSGTPTNANVGANNVTLRVNDGTTDVDQNFIVNVTNSNDAPSFTSAPVTTGSEDVLYTYNITTTDPDFGSTLVITAPTLPAWLTLTDNGDGTGVLSGTPANTEVGLHNISLRVSDGLTFVNQAFTINVGNTNDAPSFTSTAVTTATEDTAYTYDITTTDPDTGAILVITAPTLPAWLTLVDNGNGTASLSGTPTDANVGANNVTLNVSDGIANVDQIFIITVSNINDAPSFTSTPITTGTEDSVYTYLITASDPDLGAVLSINGPTLPSWLTLTDNGNGTATLSGTPANVNVGNNSVVLEVFDGTVTIPQTFTIVVSNTNDAPAFTSTTVTSAAEGAPYIYNITTNDLDIGDTLTITAPVLPTWLTITDNGDGTASLNGTPASTDAGNHNVSLHVSDGIASADQLFTILVSSMNSSPVITLQSSSKNVDESSPLFFDAANSTVITVNDPDAGAGNLQVTLNVTQGTLTLATTSGLAITPPADGSGDTSITFTATLTDINAALNGMRYDPSTGYNGGDTLQITVDDLGNTGLGGNMTTNASMDLNMAAMPPKVVSNGINSVSDTGDGILSESEIVTVGITQFIVTFDQDVNNPLGDTDISDVTNPANYKLVHDNGNDFQTTICSGGINSQDVSININSVVYDNHSGRGPFVATLNVNDGLPLAYGNYRLFICGTTSITDPYGLKLAGDGVNVGTDMTRSFTVVNNTGGGGGNGGGNASNSSPDTFSIAGALIPVTGFAPNVITTIPAQPVEEAYNSTGSLRLEIPSLSINKPVVGIQFKNKRWDVKWLEDSIGYLEGSAYPTWTGNSVLTGHATDANGNITSFGYIREITVGEKIMIHSNGMIYVYQVKENRLILPSNTKLLFKHQDYSWITLVTCENYNEDIGKYTSRRMVRAVLISVIPEK